jgi:hypothetical protein
MKPTLLLESGRSESDLDTNDFAAVPVSGGQRLGFHAKSRVTRNNPLLNICAHIPAYLSINRRTNMPLLRSLGKDQGALAAIDMALLRSFSNRFMVRVRIPRMLKLSMNRRTDMAFPRSLGKDQGALAAIDMALLRSFSNRFMVPMHARSEMSLTRCPRAKF